MLHQLKQKTILPFPQIFVVMGFTLSQTRENPCWLAPIWLSQEILPTAEPVFRGHRLTAPKSGLGL